MRKAEGAKRTGLVARTRRQHPYTVRTRWPESQPPRRVLPSIPATRPTPATASLRSRAPARLPTDRFRVDQQDLLRAFDLPINGQLDAAVVALSTGRQISTIRIGSRIACLPGSFGR